MNGSERSERRSFVLALWDGGGVVPPCIDVARELIERGHDVRVIGDPTIEPEARAVRAEFSAWRRAPHRTTRDRSADILRDYAATNKREYLKNELGGYFFARGADWTADILEVIDAHGADVVLTDSMVPWGVLAAEIRGLPSAVLHTMPYMIPTPGMTPTGAARLRVPGFLEGPRDAFLRWVLTKVFDTFVPDVNRARAVHGLPPVTHTFEQLLRADTQLVLTARVFDNDGRGAPPHVHWVGPRLADPSWCEEWISPWPAEDERPLVLVGLSSTFMDQAAVLQRIVDALADLPVRALVTRGPTVRDDEVIARGDVAIVGSVPHGLVLPRAAALVTHAGHGTTLKGLAAGVPLVCMPMGRDQDDNAARVAALGAGLVVSPKAEVTRVRAAIRRVLDEPSFRAGARRVADSIRRGDGHRGAHELLEALSIRQPTRRDDPAARHAA